MATGNLAEAIEAVIGRVDEQRLWRRHREIAQFGATGRGGVNRQALTPEDTAARRQLLQWAAARGFAVSVDAIGNLFIRRPGRESEAAPVVAGSHLDTQPTGGNFDGIFGVLAAFEVLEAAAEAGVKTARPIEAVVWTNEEGSRFQPGTMGSAVYAGYLPLAEALGSVDNQGTRLGDSLKAMLDALAVTTRREFRAPIAAYLEAHIEQGPILEAEHRRIGVVTGIQGLKWLRVEVKGEEAHAGTTPRRARRDACAAAIEMISALRELTSDEADLLRFTVGRFELSPNSPNTVPGSAFFTIDLRHPDRDLLANIGAQIEPLCRSQAAGCIVNVIETLDSPPVRFDPAIVAMVRRAAERQQLPCLELVSGATHDAKFIAELCPAGMVFIPCERGISHNETERASVSDLAAGARVLAEVILTLAGV
ncbi:MAG TPA: Zn-dependent hydrolase [Candidatus Binataceae bacterium]|nr:Zn-dependent hydrolase [Candidatus Binataceae bacterium]